MNIPNPKAKFGECVDVLNYRKAHKCWEAGHISGLSYKDKFGGGFAWGYTVTLNRRSASDNLIFLYVGSESIR